MIRRIVLWMFAATCGVADAAEGPYLQIEGEPGERLPLAMTTADVAIVGMIADVTLRQVFENRGDRTIEAVYVFPASEKAAVDALTVRIGARTLVAEIAEKEQAKARYEEAKEEGRTTALLEQVDPSAFRMSVANILPGDRIETELHYTELLVPTEGTYEFVFPTTLGDPYGPGSDPVVAAPKSRSADVVDFSFDIRVGLESAVPIGAVASPSHRITQSSEAATRVVVGLDESEARKAAARDFVLRYSLAGDEVQAGLLAFPEGDGGYFLLAAEPPPAPPADAVVPREFIFVVDVSGSMIGEPLDLTKALVRDLFASLTPKDRLNVVLFSGGSKVLSPVGSIAAEPGNLARVLAAIDAEGAGGGTELVQAIDVAHGLPRTEGLSRSMVLVTDGQISAGGEAYRAIRSRLDQANVFAFGVGASVSRDVIARLARAGAGEPFIVDDATDGAAVAARLRRYIDRPLLSGITLATQGVETFDREPDPLPDLLAERPLVVVGRYRGPLAGSITLAGRSASGQWTREIPVLPDAASTRHAAIRQLWARQRVQRLLDESASAFGARGDDANDAEVKALGLRHSLLTPFTSFVAVDRQVRADGVADVVRQPAIRRPAVFGGAGYVRDVIDHRASTRVALAGIDGPVTARRTLAGHQFARIGDTWVDARYVPGSTVLRIRRDSAAMQALLGIAPELAPLLQLDGRIVVVVGRAVVVIGTTGFGTYPELSLRRALGRPR
jgi:Ca-activated chloride channel family protein